MQSHYEQLAAINVNEHVEKKNGLSYLSWTWALDQLLRLDPEAALQRALAKAIALHGLGIYIYAGEDLPEAADKTDRSPKVEKPAPVAAKPEATQQPKVPAAPGAKLSADQVARVKALLAETGTALQRLLDFFRVQRIEDIAAADYERVIQTLERAKRKAA